MKRKTTSHKGKEKARKVEKPPDKLVVNPSSSNEQKTSEVKDETSHVVQSSADVVDNTSPTQLEPQQEQPSAAAENERAQPAEDKLIQKFKKMYYRNGKFDLTSQVPYLSQLAHRYKQKYEESGEWTDCLKAHSLYNSLSAREPGNEHWVRQAFELQKLYWRESSSIDYETQRTLTNKLKFELEHIRDKYRVEIKLADELVSQFDSKTVDSEKQDEFCDEMRKLSSECSEEMRKFAGRVIEESLTVFRCASLCDFEAVAIGSIAKGEATPYSDLEFLFLVDKNTSESLNYFNTLAMTSYFLIGNLCETKLSYMAIKELHGWFDDRGKNGFKIDGLVDGAGNIPTGNNPQNENHFIVTPKELAERYNTILHNPDLKTAIRGDLTAMLAYTVSIYSHQHVRKTGLLQELRDLIRQANCEQTSWFQYFKNLILLRPSRKDVNMLMLKSDARKFNFVPDDKLREKGFNADVKKELYRFPSIMLLDICIVSKCIGTSSWHSLEMLNTSSGISGDFCFSLQFLVAVSIYIRLATYLYHDSHDDRVSLTVETTNTPGTLEKPDAKPNRNSQRWFLPSWLFARICILMLPLKNLLSEESFEIEHLSEYKNKSDLWWLNVTTLYYSGNCSQALSELKQKYEGLCERPVELSLHIASRLPQSKYDTLYIISETLFWCGEYRAALQLYQYMTVNDISDERVRSADCHVHLGNQSKAKEILKSISEKSPGVYFSIGSAYWSSGRCDEAEANYLQALQIHYNKTSVETLTDYYGDPLPVDNYDKVDLIGAASPEQRLNMITNITPDIIACVGSLGDVYNKKKQHRRAEAYYSKTVEFIHELFGRGAAVLPAAVILNNQGLNYNEMKRYSNADQCYTEALAIFGKISPGDDTVNIADTLNNQGINYSSMKQYSNADQCYTEALGIYRKLSPDDGSVDIATTLNNQGANYSRMTQYSDANQCYTEAVAIYRKLSRGDDNVVIAETLYNQANNFSKAGDESKAREKLREALNIFKRLDSDNP